MASKRQLTGMTGVYLVAAELSKRGYIASPTSRSAQGADILVTDTECKRLYAVQVKTNARTFSFWLLGAKAQSMVSKSLIYALVNLRKDETEFYIVPSKVVASRMLTSKPSATRGTTWYQINRDKIMRYKDGWELFEK